MTIVAFKDGILVSDSAVTNEYYRFGFASNKIGKLCDNAWYGFAGSLYDLNAFISSNYFPYATIADVLKQLSQDWDDSSQFILIRKYGKEYNYSLFSKGGKVLQNINYPFYALGSGSYFAIGAMANGADAKKAVEIACEYDIHSGGPLTIINTNEQEN